ncbi:unnamed protein product [Closterium sp. NIES-54]
MRRVQTRRSQLRRAQQRKGRWRRGATGRRQTSRGGAGSAAAGDDAGKAGHGDFPAETLDGKEIVAIVETFIAEHVAGLRGELASTAEGLKQQVDAVRSEAADAAGALKAEMARIKAAAERQAAEVAYVRAIAAHAEERTNDLELAVAEGKSAREKARAEKVRAEERGCAETPEGKRRKLDEAGKAEGVASAAAGGRALVANRGASDGKRDESRCRWWCYCLILLIICIPLPATLTTQPSTPSLQALLTLWAKAAPQQTEMEFIIVSNLSNAALSCLTSLRQLISVNLRKSSGFSAAGVRQLYSLPSLMHLELTGSCTDAALEGIDRVKSLRTLVLYYSKVTNAGLAKLEGMTSLLKLHLGGCESITSDGMIYVGKLTALEELSLHETGVGKDGLSYLTSLT